MFGRISKVWLVVNIHVTGLLTALFVARPAPRVNAGYVVPRVLLVKVLEGVQKVCL